VSLSLRQKQSLYHSFGQLIRSGVPIPGALQGLAATCSGAERRLIKRLNQAVAAGKTLGQAFAAERPDVSELEIGVVAACEKSGRLEFGMTQLASYHGALAAARENILKQCAYPGFVLLFGVFVPPLKDLIVGGNVLAYLKATIGPLILVAGILLIFYLLYTILRDSGANSATFDSFLRLIPKVGKIRRAFATSRFCATYGMQLDAGINVLDALEAAQRSSLSGLMQRAVRNTIPEVRNGLQVGPLLAASGAFPEPMTRALLVGEQTGQLDEELTRMTKEYQEEAVARLQTLAFWIPKLLYSAVVVYVAYRIIKMYMASWADATKMFDL